MERAIIKSEDGKQYFFYDNPEWEVDSRGSRKLKNQNFSTH